MTASDATLFGLPTPDTSPGPNEQSLLDLKADYEAAGQLHSRTAVLMTALLEIARGVDRGLQASKVTIATTNLTRMLIDGINELPALKRESEDAYSTLDRVISEMTAKALA